VRWVIPDKTEPPRVTKVSMLLQEQFLNSPPVAIQQIKKAILHMFVRAYEMLGHIKDDISNDNNEKKDEIIKLEDELDRHQAEITEYISLVMHKGVSVSDSETLTHLLHAVNDVENIGDSVESTSNLLQRLAKLGQKFSPAAKSDIIEMVTLVASMVDDSIRALEHESRRTAMSAIEKEARIDEMKRKFRKRNRDRYVAYKRGESTTEEKLWGQVISNDVISNMEKIADNAENVLEAYKLAAESKPTDQWVRDHEA
ncbi:MAG: Na/Pi cotransporter family protein, partial [Candidatus Coatesbacteria bacterium]|nr:Na/Pi cotransporter family protein [Candidatus Coatesbacteria bacterium]